MQMLEFFYLGVVLRKKGEEGGEHTSLGGNGKRIFHCVILRPEHFASTKGCALLGDLEPRTGSIVVLHIGYCGFGEVGDEWPMVEDGLVKTKADLVGVRFDVFTFSG
jgi:hypothetical protein